MVNVYEITTDYFCWNLIYFCIPYIHIRQLAIFSKKKKKKYKAIEIIIIIINTAISAEFPSPSLHLDDFNFLLL